MPQLDITFYPSQVFWFLISFFLLWIGFQWWIVPIMREIFSQRKKELQTLVDQAVQLQKEAESIKEESMKSMHLCQSRCADVIAKTLREKSEKHQECVDQLRQEYATRIQDLYEYLKEETKKWNKDHKYHTIHHLADDFLQQKVFHQPRKKI